MIEINKLSFEIDEKVILKDINLKINKGTIFGIIGPNGVGKTTLLRCLTGIYQPTCGSVNYDGREVYDNVDVKSEIGYVADENIMQSKFKVKEILKYYKYSYKNFDEVRFNQLNKIFKIPTNKFIFQLSKGMKMRLSIMLSFSIKAKYLILDEPTSGLDAILKNKLLKLFADEVIENGTTIVISSHHLSELERICDEVAILDEGVVSYENSVENMKNKIKKIQVAFDKQISEEELKLKGNNKISKVGRVFTIITDEYDEELIQSLKVLKPLFIEEIDLSLEDIFIYKVDKEDSYEELFK
ncbi:ABC-2 type transport system ATP-binding protein [Clostridium saccharoperbutylacetonicum]|uniref:ABC-type multidrug transport system, ATPase component n=1 Tax=Clostridium saccharoperbutylacetonicum N1-4(HMT) TaxID=931276 RepID=M1LVX3_9CLOT|nr:ABC transporter ATP-binding protein [Clostridium saccharoperbutylacetonicum]AGF57315.1 ABC-type multidrug transport system, ATPase component [Clostridium saccharoperbutylacetonicum N1-4(HMT)]NRT61922.1 ABC-2 type transport system ATP-binding protein [Clostridium saccharoperbutylacetonicum]NSB25251.1 ABC-2 type transport system ATP-binding protein [Clostridium saccharoperbutylacetonicum]NSB44620.1 ABC-2 type transport system ATP-binding protein [Clostridium saccharoperbutylacetonicum]